MNTRDSGRKLDHAADVEDRPAARVDHVLAEDLAAQVRGQQVAVDDAVELFVGDVEVGRRRIDAGAVHQRRRRGRAASTTASSSASTDARSVASTADEAGRAAELLDRRDALVAALGASPGDDDVGPGLRQAFAQRAAQHARAADHHGDLAVESEQFLQVVGGHRRFKWGRAEGGSANGKLSLVSSGGRRSRIQSVWNAPGLSMRSYVWAPK